MDLRPLARRIPPEVRQFASVLTRAGHQCHLVGGALRDLLLGRQSSDFDVATDATPPDVQRLYRRTIPTGIKHGTVTVLFHGTTFEVTTFRTESIYSDGRRPDAVAFATTIDEDLSRRDFTINAIAFNLQDDSVTDPFDGRGDLQRRMVRAVGDPAKRFQEDGLRTLRACRFIAQLGFQPDPATRTAMATAAAAITRIAAERIRDELDKLLVADFAARGLQLAARTGLVQLVLPEVAEGIGVEQRSPNRQLHCFDVFGHSVAVCQAAPPHKLLRWAALLHDVAKPRTRKIDANGDVTFHGHDQLSADLAVAILHRLHSPKAFGADVAHLIRQHMFLYTPEWGDAAVRRFLARVGLDHLNDLLALRRADQIGRCNRLEEAASMKSLRSRIEAVLAGQAALSIRDLAVSGSDVMEALDIAPGRVVGAVLAQLLEAVMDDPRKNRREELLGLAQRFYRGRLMPPDET